MKPIYAVRWRALLPLLAFLWSGLTNAAVFHLAYDDTANGVIDGTSVIRGTGAFSYDGPAAAGSFLLSDLTGVSFSATFGSTTFVGPPFDPADLALMGISVSDAGGGLFELVFTGQSAATNGSLDIVGANSLLSHQPSPLGGNDVGLNLYFVRAPGASFFGDYRATTANVPEPVTLALLGFGIAGIAATRRRKQ